MIYFNEDGIQQYAATLVGSLNSTDGLNVYQADNCNQFVHHNNNCLENGAFLGRLQGGQVTRRRSLFFTFVSEFF